MILLMLRRLRLPRIIVRSVVEREIVQVTTLYVVEVKREVDARVSAGRVDRRVDVDCRGQRVLLRSVDAVFVDHDGQTGMLGRGGGRS